MTCARSTHLKSPCRGAHVCPTWDKVGRWIPADFHTNQNLDLGVDGCLCSSWDLNLPSVFMGKNEISVIANRLTGAGRRLYLLRSSVPALQFTSSPFPHQLLIFNCSFAKGLCLLSCKEGGEEGVRSVVLKSPKETIKWKISGGGKHSCM